MGVDYTEKERSFVESLEADTGSGLEAWMAAISAQGLTDKNDIIDWLRGQGFTFSNASWLERIHHNGGKLIYADAPPPEPPSPRRKSKTERAAAPPPSQTLDDEIIFEPLTAHVAAPLAAPPAAPPPVTPPASVRSGDTLDAVLAAAKAYRPLAQFLLAEIARTLPGIHVRPDQPFVRFAAPRDFATLAISAKDLRLMFDAGAPPLPQTLKKASLGTGRAVPYPHMAVLTDARQIDAALLALVESAAKRAAVLDKG